VGSARAGRAIKAEAGAGADPRRRRRRLDLITA
jgi:hypothetical protein